MGNGILIVDDDAAMGEMLARGLAREGFDCRSCTAGGEALSLMETASFDVVVTDLNMRAMNGLDLCGRIMANRPDVPVVVITAFGSLDTAVGAIRAGAYDFITKPVDVDALALGVGAAVKLVTPKRRITCQVSAGENPACSRISCLRYQSNGFRKISVAFCDPFSTLERRIRL